MDKLNCYIFSVDFNKAKGKLEEIISEKKSRGVELVEYHNNICCASTVFSDGEIWKIVSTANSARGIKWHKAWVDYDIPHRILEEVVVPAGIFKVEELKFF